MINVASKLRMEELRKMLLDPTALMGDGQQSWDEQVVQSLLTPDEAEGYRRTGRLFGAEFGRLLLRGLDGPVAFLKLCLPGWGYSLSEPQEPIKVTSAENGGVDGWLIRPAHTCVLSRHERLRSDKGPHEVWIGESKINMACAIVDAICVVGIKSHFNNTRLGEHD